MYSLRAWLPSFKKTFLSKLVWMSRIFEPLLIIAISLELVVALLVALCTMFLSSIMSYKKNSILSISSGLLFAHALFLSAVSSACFLPDYYSYIFS